MRKWSVKEFEGLIRHQLTDAQGPVELIDGAIVPLPSGEQIERQMTLLTDYIRRHLSEQGIEGFEVRSHYPLYIDDYSVIKPAISLLKSTENSTESQVICPWAIDICKAHTDHSTRAALYAQFDVQEYWTLNIEQVELRVSTVPHGNIYQQQRLLMVGEQTSPQPLPQLQLSLREPLPLYFLTRTSQGQRTYIGEGVPLQIAGTGYHQTLKLESRV